MMEHALTAGYVQERSAAAAASSAHFFPRESEPPKWAPRLISSVGHPRTFATLAAAVAGQTAVAD